MKREAKNIDLREPGLSASSAAAALFPASRLTIQLNADYLAASSAAQSCVMLTKLGLSLGLHDLILS